MIPKKTLFSTILYNRPKMLKLAALNLLTHAQNGRYVLWDNGDDPEVTKFCEKLVVENDNTTVEVIYHKSENIGLNAAKKIADLYLDDCEFLMSLDEDILFLQMGFQSILQEILLQTEKPIGYVACNVFQDGFTNGARPGLDQYTEGTVSSRRVLYGPTGGWATMTSAEVYKSVGGFPEHKEKFYGLDGMYSSKIYKKKMDTAIAKDVLCYHATGPAWNDYFKYQKIHQDKMDAYNKSKT